MNKTIFNTLMISLVLSLTACGQSSSNKSKGDGLAKLDGTPVALEAGKYKATVACVDEEANKNIPEVEMFMEFKADGTFTESMKVVHCDTGCSYAMTGKYALTETTMRLVQLTQTDVDRKTTTSKKVTIDMKVMNHDQDTKTLVIAADEKGNMCSGEIIITLVKQ
jgi:hypothetical protein